MSELNTINGGYVGGSPKVKSTNFKKPFVDLKIKEINPQELSDKITYWLDSGKITIEGVQIIADNLQGLCGNTITQYGESLQSLESKISTLDIEVQSRKDQLSSMAKSEDLADMVETLETFFGKDKIQNIRNLLKNQ
jgi:hypothetical protein